MSPKTQARNHDKQADRSLGAGRARLNALPIGVRGRRRAQSHSPGFVGPQEKERERERDRFAIARRQLQEHLIMSDWARLTQMERENVVGAALLSLGAKLSLLKLKLGSSCKLAQIAQLRPRSRPLGSDAHKHTDRQEATLISATAAAAANSFGARALVAVNSLQANSGHLGLVTRRD